MQNKNKNKMLIHHANFNQQRATENARFGLCSCGSSPSPKPEPARSPADEENTERRRAKKRGRPTKEQLLIAAADRAASASRFRSLLVGASTNERTTTASPSTGRSSDTSSAKPMRAIRRSLDKYHHDRQWLTQTSFRGALQLLTLRQPRRTAEQVNRSCF